MKQDRSLHTQQTVLLLIASFVLGAVATPAISYAEYIWGEAWATEATDPEHMGYWEYCISMGWDMSDYSEGAHGASHVSLLLELEDCLADCGEACFAFEDTVGTGHGVEGCEVYFYAELDIKGDPTVPAESPTLKFEPYPDACEPDVKGTAYFCFYSLCLRKRMTPHRHRFGSSSVPTPRKAWSRASCRAAAAPCPPTFRPGAP